jgi:hypothetical protein
MTITRFAVLDVALTGNTKTSRTGGVALTTPEVGTLDLLGTGLIGLAGFTKRELKRHEA